MISALRDGHSVDLDIERAGPLRDAEEDSGRRVLGEVAFVDLVEGLEALGGYAEHVALQHVIEVRPRRLQRCLHLFEDALGLAFERRMRRISPVSGSKGGMPDMNTMSPARVPRPVGSTRAGDMVFMSGMPPFDPDTGELLQHAPFERQAERILEQMKTALEAAGSDLDHVLKCNVLCISAERFKTFNEIYKRYFPKNPPARIFFCVPEWTGPFDIEIDCVAVTKS